MNTLFITQFVVYFFVGGVAALVEWGSFYTLHKVAGLHYMFCVVISFILSTYVNWILGRFTVFKKAKRNKKFEEISLVYLVSAIALLINIISMYFFVSLIHLPAMFSKVASTGIAFIWNFFSRKCFIYKI